MKESYWIAKCCCTHYEFIPNAKQKYNSKNKLINKKKKKKKKKLKLKGKQIKSEIGLFSCIITN